MNIILSCSIFFMNKESQEMKVKKHLKRISVEYGSQQRHPCWIIPTNYTLYSVKCTCKMHQKEIDGNWTITFPLTH